MADLLSMVCIGCRRSKERHDPSLADLSIEPFSTPIGTFTPYSPIVKRVLTASVTAELLEMFKSSKACGYITKPINIRTPVDQALELARNHQ